MNRHLLSAWQVFTGWLVGLVGYLACKYNGVHPMRIIQSGITLSVSTEVLLLCKYGKSKNLSLCKITLIDFLCSKVGET